MKLLLFSFFLKREEEDKEEEETLEMIALPLCLLRFVRVRALAVVVALVGGIDDDDNIFYLHSLFCFCVTFFWRERERFFFVMSEHSRPKFSFFVSFDAFLFRCWFRTIQSARLSRFFPSCWFLSFVFGKRGGLSPLQREDDDDDVNENDDWVCKNNDYCFHPDIIIVIVFVAKKFKDHL